jgi:hypothetical protein
VGPNWGGALGSLHSHLKAKRLQLNLPEEKAVFERLMDRLRRIAPRSQGGYAPVMVPALC